MQNQEILAEIERLKRCFPAAEENKLEACAGLIEQAACERIYLRRLNEQALICGLVQINPNNPNQQRVLPISQEIARHAATLTNIIDKLVKHLGAMQEDDNEELKAYE